MPRNMSAPAEGVFTVVPSDTVYFSEQARSLYIGVSGNVSLVAEDNSTAVFTAVPVGVLPVRCKRINVTGTTATNIVGLL